MTYGTQMNKWHVEDFLEEDGVGFVVTHYVGGEDPYECYDYYDDEAEAQAVADKLNKAGITYEFSSAEGNVKIHIDWNGVQ